MWPQVLDEVKKRRRFTWILLSQNSHVVDVAGGTLTLGLTNTGARDNFVRGGSEEILTEALAEVLQTRLKIQAIVEAAERPAPAAPSASAAPAPGFAGGADSVAGSAATAPPTPAPAEPPPGPATPPPAAPPSAPEVDRSALRGAIRPTRHGGQATPDEPEGPDVDQFVDRDDEVLNDDHESHTELLARHLGAEIINDEVEH